MTNTFPPYVTLYKICFPPILLGNQVQYIIMISFYSSSPKLNTNPDLINVLKNYRNMLFLPFEKFCWVFSSQDHSYFFWPNMEYFDRDWVFLFGDSISILLEPCDQLYHTSEQTIVGEVVGCLLMDFK